MVRQRGGIVILNKHRRVALDNKYAEIYKSIPETY